MQEVVRRKKAEKFFNDSYDHVAMLAGRWADEKGYEDINDYKKNLQNSYSKSHGIVIKDMLTSPFGLTWFVNGASKVLYKSWMKLNGEYGYKRIA